MKLPKLIIFIYSPSLSPVPLPVVTISPGSVDVTVISTVILTCEVQSLTSPNVTWTSSTNVTLSSTSLVSNENIYNSTLKLEQVTLEYIGEYTCTAENEGGEISDTITVNVYGEVMCVTIHMSVLLFTNKSEYCVRNAYCTILRLILKVYYLLTNLFHSFIRNSRYYFQFTNCNY